MVTPEDWWRALPANVADGYAAKVVAAVELLYPTARVTHAVMGAQAVRVDLVGASRRSYRGDDNETPEEIERLLDEVAQDVWGRETG